MKNEADKWYYIEETGQIDSPSMVLYKDHLEYNIQNMISMVGDDPSKLMPHIKTNKMPKVVELMIDHGIENFKAATIAEAEMAAISGAKSVLIAHQLVGPKIQRFSNLISKYQECDFTTIVDNVQSAQELNSAAREIHAKIGVYIDINSGMNRSGIELGEGLDKLIKLLISLQNIEFLGLHVYDGHIRNPEFSLRNSRVEKGIDIVEQKFVELRIVNPNLQMICGGTPTFSSHLNVETRIASPGTCVLWDWGYDRMLEEQNFKFAALLISRVISKPTHGIITIDLGHKSVAAENPLDKRVRFLNIENYELISQSEEHGVLKIKDWEHITVGDLLYGVPFHICPTINLYDGITVIENNKRLDCWSILGGKRFISV